MHSFARAIATALLLAALTPGLDAQSTQPRTLYAEALAREAALRHELDVHRLDAPAEPLLLRVRTLVTTYEDMARLFPASGYSDNSLWQGASLAADAFWQFGESGDRATALRLFNALTARFPTSSLVPRVRAQVKRLDEVQAPPASAPAELRVPTAPAAARVPPMPPSSAVTTVVALKAIRREVLPDALRITLELEREVPFHDERLDAPPRIFIDLPNTRAVDALKDAVIPFTDDVVAQVRVGRQLDSRTRVVLDLKTAGAHSVYALYDPYRVVIDFERTKDTKSADTKVTKESEAKDARNGDMKATTAATIPANAPGASWTPALPRARPSAPASEPRAGADAARVPASGPGEPGAARVPQSGAVAVAPDAGRTPRPSALPQGQGRPEPGRGTAGAGRLEPVDGRSGPAATAAAEMAPAPAVTTAPASEATVAPAPPAVNTGGGFSLSRQLGLGVTRIVIDAGHGGRDPGAKLKGLTEAEIVLDVALRLEKLLLKERGVEVLLTRRSNAFIPLEERTAIANRGGADLFLSIHANASADASARGIETYFLNFAPNQEAEAIAARENAGSSKSMRHLPDIVKAIALNNKIDESRDFATMVQAALYGGLGKVNKNLKNLGVKQAPFMVLIGATMPSVLAEISFMSNSQEATLLKTGKYRQQIAEALFAGVMRYQQSLKKVPAVAAK